MWKGSTTNPLQNKRNSKRKRENAVRVKISRELHELQ